MKFNKTERDPKRAKEIQRDQRDSMIKILLDLLSNVVSNDWCFQIVQLNQLFHLKLIVHHYLKIYQRDCH